MHAGRRAEPGFFIPGQFVVAAVFEIDIRLQAVENIDKCFDCLLQAGPACRGGFPGRCARQSWPWRLVSVADVVVSIDVALELAQALREHERDRPNVGGVLRRAVLLDGCRGPVR